MFFHFFVLAASCCNDIIIVSLSEVNTSRNEILLEATPPYGKTPGSHMTCYSFMQRLGACLAGEVK